MPKDDSPQRIVLGFRLVEALRDVLQGVAAYVKRHRLNWQIQCVDADEFVAALAPGRADGAITVIGRRSPELLAAVKRTGVPVVNLLHDARPALPSVESDNVAIGRVGGEYLLGRGFRHFAYLGFDTAWSHDRQTGFAAAVARAGHACRACDRFAAVTDFRRISAPRAIRELREWVAGLPRPVGIMACCDLVATSLLAACAGAGVRVPDEAAVLGVDNLVATCELAPVPLSSVAQDFPAMGYEAARLLHRLLRARRGSRGSRGLRAPRTGAAASIVARMTVIPPARVVVRRSTDVLAFDDEHVAAAMQAIHEHAPDGIRMKELLRRVPVSRRWLDARFKAVVGRTASEEIRRLRLARIRDLLEQTDLSIKQIALRCGFSRGENLIRFFRDAHGVPPQAYRARLVRPR